MPLRQLLLLYCWLIVCKGAGITEIYLAGSGSNLGRSLVSCAGACAMENRCKGITLSSPETCQLHLLGQSAVPEYVRQRSVIQQCISSQVPTRPLVDSGILDGHNWIIVFLAPFEKRAAIHTVNFYAGRTTSFDVYILDALSIDPWEFRVDQAFTISNVNIGYNTQIVDSLDAQEGQYYAIWFQQGVIKWNGGLQDAVNLVGFVGSLGYDVGDTFSISLFNAYNYREYQLELLYTTCL